MSQCNGISSNPRFLLFHRPLKKISVPCGFANVKLAAWPHPASHRGASHLANEEEEEAAARITLPSKSGAASSRQETGSLSHTHPPLPRKDRPARALDGLDFRDLNLLFSSSLSPLQRLGLVCSIVASRRCQRWSFALTRARVSLVRMTRSERDSLLVHERSNRSLQRKSVQGERKRPDCCSGELNSDLLYAAFV